MAGLVAVRADATPEVGSGHVVRLLGLVDELRARGVPCLLAGSVEIPWVLDLLSTRGVTPSPAPAEPAAFLAWCRDRGVDAVVLDGYDLPGDLGVTLRAGGLLVLSMRDGGHGAGQACDVAVDPNLGGERDPLAREGVLLAGAAYTLFRDEVLEAVPGPWEPPHEGHRVLAFFGGSDACGAAEVVVPLLLAAADPVDLRVVAPDPAVARRLAALPRTGTQQVTVLPPRPDLLSVARAADAVVTATGGSVWELLVHGIPFACVQVADNQEVGYRELSRRQLCVGLGALDRLRSDPSARRQAVDDLRALAGDPALRATLAARGRGLFDGRGRVRVVDTFLPGTRTAGGGVRGDSHPPAVPSATPPRPPMNPQPTPVTEDLS